MIAKIGTYSTQEGLEIFEGIKSKLGNIVSAEIIGDQYSEQELILTDEDGEKVVFIGCFSAGICGEGSRGTCKVLNTLGFNKDLNFVQKNDNFKIIK